MKKKLLIVLMVVLTLCASMFILSACEETYTTTETDSIIAELNESVASNKTELNAKISALEEEYKLKDSELLSKITAGEQALANLKTNYETELKALKDKDEVTDKAIADLDAKYLAEVEKLEKADSDNAQALANLKTNYETELKALKDKDEATDKAIADLDAKYLAEVEKLNGDILALNAQIQANKTELENKINNLKSVYDTKIAEINDIIELLKTTTSSQQEVINSLIERIAELEKTHQEAHVHTFGESIDLSGYDVNCENKILCQVCQTCNEIKFICGCSHNWQENYTTDDSSHWISCSNCTAIKDKEEHEINGFNKCATCNFNLATQGVEYSLSQDGTYAQVTGYNGEETAVIISSEYQGKPVKTVFNNAFSNDENITSVKIPDSVTSIGDRAFYDCSSLTSVVIGDSVTSIGDRAFYYCSSLTSVVIGDSVTSIGGRAFSDCTSLTSIEIPDSVTSIGDYAFSGCASLKVIEVAEDNPNYKSIDGNLYSKDGKTLIKYAIGKTATTFTIPNSVTSIGDDAFYGCTSLEAIEIPNSVTSIGCVAFRACTSLTNIEIPNSVTNIGWAAFWSCDNLQYKIENNLKYLGNSKNPYLYLADVSSKEITTAIVNDNCRFISEEAFGGCHSLKSVTIGTNVTSIGQYAFVFWGEGSLESVTFRDSSNWYAATNETDWWNQTNGTLVNLSNATKNAEYLESTYIGCYWYKKV